MDRSVDQKTATGSFGSRGAESTSRSQRPVSASQRFFESLQGERSFLADRRLSRPLKVERGLRPNPLTYPWRNLHDYALLKLALPLVAPALADALFAATGVRRQSLPLAARRQPHPRVSRCCAAPPRRR